MIPTVAADLYKVQHLSPLAAEISVQTHVDDSPGLPVLDSAVLAAAIKLRYIAFLRCRLLISPPPIPFADICRPV